MKCLPGAEQKNLGYVFPKTKSIVLFNFIWSTHLLEKKEQKMIVIVILQK